MIQMNLLTKQKQTHRLREQARGHQWWRKWVKGGIRSLGLTCLHIALFEIKSLSMKKGLFKHIWPFFHKTIKQNERSVLECDGAWLAESLTPGGIFWAEKWFMKLVGGTVFQAEGTARAKTWDTLSFFEEQWEVQCGWRHMGRANGGEMFREVFKEHGGAGVYLSMISHWRIVRRESKMIWFILWENHSGCCDCKKAITCCQLSYRYLQYHRMSILRALWAFVFQQHSGWTNNWMNLSMKGSGCPSSGCPRRRILCYPILITVLSHQVYLDLLQANRHVVNRKFTQILMEENSSFYLVSNWRSENIHFFS